MDDKHLSYLFYSDFHYLNIGHLSSREEKKVICTENHIFKTDMHGVHVLQINVQFDFVAIRK